ncbi:hypothetical protein FOL47_002295 [Perkinsus chesapeaki]|uniref:JmjC domain-containing protein n=1 Tax=Perkinsus chesapeaki TaxID=330153 RepID=A0A7J6MG44_PERCH|nr:hypothetical protein FOL47_002295 [Perkinsus chesapeaki]
MSCPNGCRPGSCQLKWEAIPVRSDPAEMRTAKEPFIIRQWRSVDGNSPWASIRGVMEVASDAVAGTKVDGKDAFMSVKEALKNIEEGRSVHIKGWEYVAQGCQAPIELDIEKDCMLLNNKSMLARKVSEVMRWVFIGTKGTGSACHIDPLASAAWMWMTHGRKEWRMASGTPANIDQLPPLFECTEELKSYRHLYHFVMNPGDLLFIPRGCLHEVRNMNTTIAVTHNVVLEPAALWDEVRRVLTLVVAYGGLEPLEGHPKVDSLLFGTLMACLYGDMEMPEDIERKVEKIRPSIDFTEE